MEAADLAGGLLSSRPRVTSPWRPQRVPSPLLLLGILEEIESESFEAGVDTHTHTVHLLTGSLNTRIHEEVSEGTERCKVRALEVLNIGLRKPFTEYLAVFNYVH